MIGRTLVMATALFGAFVASQAPEFAQQYRQRLGGTVDELGRSVADFDRDATTAGFDRGQAITSMKSAQEPLVQLRGASTEATVERYDRLRAQQQAFESSDTLGKVQAMITSPDQPLVQATLADYAPAIPTTPAGLFTAAAGFVLVYLVYGVGRVATIPMRKRRRMRALGQIVR